MATEMMSYYARRAGVYEQIYRLTDWQPDLDELRPTAELPSICSLPYLDSWVVAIRTNGSLLIKCSLMILATSSAPFSV